MELRLGTPVLLKLLGAGVVAMLGGLLVGIPSLRVKGLYLAISTIAASFIAHFVFANWAFTGGTGGLQVPPARLLGIDLDTSFKIYWLIVPLTALMVLEMCIRDSLYADRITDSMQRAMEETSRRRAKQLQFNTDHGITARGVQKAVRELIDGIVAPVQHDALEAAVPAELLKDEKALAREIKRLEKLMMDHARNLEFEQAAAARDALTALKQRVLLDGAV